MKLNFKYILFTFVLMFAINTAFAQAGKKDKIDALRMAFINKKVNFTPAESQTFWPLYNEMNDKLEAVRKTFSSQYNSKTNYDFEFYCELNVFLTASNLSFISLYNGQNVCD